MTLKFIDNKIFLQLESGERYLGFTRKSYFVTERNKNHFFRRHLGFGFCAELLKELPIRGVNWVIIIYTKADGKKQGLYANVSDINKWGIRVCEGGFEPQIIFPLSRFSKWDSASAGMGVC